MEWLDELIKYNSTVIKGGLDVFVDSISETASSIGQKLLDFALLPLAAFLLRIFETSLKYFLEEDEYQKYEEVTTQSYYSALSWLQLTQFQSKLIWEFFIIILGNSLLVIIAWWWYGDRIRNQFMQPGADRRLKKIAEIRDGYSDLKLPKEMDFKFK